MFSGGLEREQWHEMGDELNSVRFTIKNNKRERTIVN